MTVEISKAFWYTDYKIVSGQPDEYTSNPFSYLLIFDMQVWILTALSYVVLSTLLWLSRIGKPDEKSQPLKDYFWGLFAIAVFQYATWEPSRALPRFFFGLWCVLVIVLMNSFSSEMISHLAAPDQPERINCLQDILNRPKMRPTIPDRTAISSYFQFSGDAVSRSVWRQSLKTGGLFNVNEFLSKPQLDHVLSGKSVLLAEDMMARFAIKRWATETKNHESEFYTGLEPFNSVGLSFMMRKTLDQNIVKAINLRILIYHETGHLQYRVARSFPNIEDTSSNLNLNFWELEETPLNMKHLIAAAVVWAIGFAASLVALLCEVSCVQTKMIKHRFMVIGRMVMVVYSTNKVVLEDETSLSSEVVAVIPKEETRVVEIKPRVVLVTSRSSEHVDEVSIEIKNSIYKRKENQNENVLDHSKMFSAKRTSIHDIIV